MGWYLLFHLSGMIGIIAAAVYKNYFSNSSYGIKSLVFNCILNIYTWLRLALLQFKKSHKLHVSQVLLHYKPDGGFYTQRFNHTSLLAGLIEQDLLTRENSFDEWAADCDIPLKNIVAVSVTYRWDDSPTSQIHLVPYGVPMRLRPEYGELVPCDHLQKENAELIPYLERSSNWHPILYYLSTSPELMEFTPRATNDCEFHHRMRPSNKKKYASGIDYVVSSLNGKESVSAVIDYAVRFLNGKKYQVDGYTIEAKAKAET